MRERETILLWFALSFSVVWKMVSETFSCDIQINANE